MQKIRSEWGEVNLIPRNMAIVLSVLNGASCVSEGNKHGITPMQIRNIVEKYCSLANRELYKQMCKFKLSWLRKHKEVFIKSLPNNATDTYVLNTLEIASIKSDIELGISVPIYKLKIGNRALTALSRNDVQTIQELMKYAEKDLKRIPNMGKSSINEIIEKLTVLNLQLPTEYKIVEL